MKSRIILYLLVGNFLLFTFGYGTDSGENETSSGVVLPDDFRQKLKYLSSDNGGKIYSTSKEGSSTDINFPSEAPPMNVSRQIISPMREDGFFMEDIIVVQLAVTSVKKEGLKDVEIWEIPGDGIEVINCSYPIVTSKVVQILDYEKSDKSFIKYTDVNIISTIKKLQDCSRSEIKNIYSMLPRWTQENLSNINLSNCNESDLVSLRSDLVRDFNNILENKSILFNASFFDISPIVSNNYLDYWINTADPIEYNTYIELEDYRLIKRRLLEYAFRKDSTEMPEGIRRLSFDKKHENMLLGPYGSINYPPLSTLNGRESIVLKYYLRPTKVGRTNIRSIIRSKDHLHEEITRINVVEPNPRFESTYVCETGILSYDTPTTFTYGIKYLGGDKEERKKFIVNVSSPGSCKIISVQTSDGKKKSVDGGEDRKSIILDFTRGTMRELNVISRYNKTGDKFPPPKISIDAYVENFDEDLSVFEGWKIFIGMYSEISTLVILALSLLITNIAAIYFGFRQMKDAEKNSLKIKDIIDNTNVLVNQFAKGNNESNKIQSVIENNTDALANLTKLINEKIK